MRWFAFFAVVLLAGSPAIPDTAKELKLAGVVLLNGGDGVMLGELKSELPGVQLIAKQVAADFGNAKFKVEGDMLLAAISDERLPKGELLRTKAESDCPNNSIFQAQTPDAITQGKELKQKAEQIMVAICRLRHKADPDTQVSQKTWHSAERFEVVLDLKSAVAAP